MKTSYPDFLLCGGTISAILASVLALIAVLRPLSSALFAEYHVIVDLMFALLFYGLLSALLVRMPLKIRPMEPGEYSMYSPVFTCWKLLTIVYRLGQGALNPFTPVFVKPLIEILFGARAGADMALGGTIDDPYMVTIGAGAVLGNASLVSGNMVYGGKFVCGAVKIGAGATIGVNSVILPGTEVEENVTLMGGRYVTPDTKIPVGETWRGNPARK